MKTQRKLMKLTPTTFVIIFCVEVETNKETSKSNIKIDAA
jgi:hypothetical protein